MPSTQPRRPKPASAPISAKAAPDQDDVGMFSEGNLNRRLVLSRMLKSSAVITLATTMGSQPSSAGEVGARINAAVTRSDVGISVRRSVVKGAQVIDNLDGKWERMSDRLNLGAERSKRDARPPPRDVPDPLPLNSETALAMLAAADASFLSIVPVGREALRKQIDKVDSLVRNTFERAGLDLARNSLEHAGMDLDEGKKVDADIFNYLAYVHFKAYGDILIEREDNFKKFRSKFEADLGREVCQLLVPKLASSPVPAYSGAANKNELKERLAMALTEVDAITESLKSMGFVALAERSEADKEKVDDWSEDMSDLLFTVALDKDATQNAQILLQEQGRYLYPDFARYAIASSLRRYLSPVKEEVLTEEYYMDTSYSSDPDAFEVKQVLLNIVIESV